MKKKIIRNCLESGRTKESYQKRKTDYKIKLSGNIEIKETKDFIGTKKIE